MINIQDLGYRYTKTQPVFNKLDLQFLPGRIYGLLGKNGAGKSTLIKNITGMLFPTEGSCEVFGNMPKYRGVDFLQDLFFVPEEYYLPNIQIQDLVDIYKGFYPSFDALQFDEYVQEFKIDKHRKTGDLSLGQKKKILIGFALSTNTKVLIMDEPTNGLDIPSKITFRNMVKNAFNQDRIVIISSHQVRDLDELIDNIIIMDQGKILLNEDKNHIAKRLKFELFNTQIENTDYIYRERLSHGYATIKKNSSGQLNYVDIEVLFNAILADDQKIHAHL